MQAQDKTTTPHQEELQLVHARYRQLLLHKEQTLTELRSRLLEYREQQLRVKVTLLSLLERRRELAIKRERRLEKRNDSRYQTISSDPEQILKKPSNLHARILPASSLLSLGVPLPTSKRASPPKSPEKKKRTCRMKWVPYPKNADPPICK